MMSLVKNIFRRRPVRRCLIAAFSLMSIVVLASLWAEDPSAGKSGEWVAPTRASKKKNPIPADSTSIALGKKVYIRECLSCHGQTGKGDGPAAQGLERHPGNLSDPKMWEQTDGALFWKVTEGRKPMPTSEKLLTEEERWHVVNYMRTLAPQPTQPRQPIKEGKTNESNP